MYQTTIIAQPAATSSNQNVLADNHWQLEGLLEECPAAGLWLSGQQETPAAVYVHTCSGSLLRWRHVVHQKPDLLYFP